MSGGRTAERHHGGRPHNSSCGPARGSCIRGSARSRSLSPEVSSLREARSLDSGFTVGSCGEGSPPRELDRSLAPLIDTMAVGPSPVSLSMNRSRAKLGTDSKRSQLPDDKAAGA